MKYKTNVTPVDDKLEYVLSDESVDRMGDVIDVKGWQLDQFKKNPIALFNHKAEWPIGTWKDIRIVGKQLRARLALAEEGTSPRIDEIRRLAKQGILRATSVGFMPLEHEPLDKDGTGLRFKKTELLETSIVSIPANPNALQLAKSMGISGDTMSLVFGEQAVADQRQGNGGHAGRQLTVSRAKKMTLAEKIQNAQDSLVQLRDKLTAVVSAEGEPDESARTQIEELNGQIADQEQNLALYKDAEKRLAQNTEQDPPTEQRGNGGSGGMTISSRRPFAAPAQKLRPQDYVWRSLTAMVTAHHNKSTLLDGIKFHYGEDEATRAVTGMLTRAATVPADTVTSGWASQLVNTALQDFFEALLPLSVYPGLSNRGGRFTFGRNGVVTLPTRSSTPTIAGSFVAQGSPIPVRQGAFTSVSLTPKKMGVISTFTREIAEHSTPAIEQLIRQAIVEDTAVAIDTVLLDNNAATTTRPAGLRSGVTVTTATSGGTITAAITDLRNLVGAIITGTNGNVRSPVWLMNPADVLALSMLQNSGGDLLFKDELAGGTLLGYPVIQSTTVTADMMLLVDASDFVSATGDDPRFDVSDQAVLHMEDTTPLAIGTVGTPNTVAAPTRSLWQTDTIAIRMLLDINWAMRRTGVIAWTQTMTWN